MKSTNITVVVSPVGATVDVGLGGATVDVGLGGATVAVGLGVEFGVLVGAGSV